MSTSQKTLFITKENSYFDNDDHSEIDIFEFMNFLNLLLKDKTSFNQLLETSLQNKNFSFLHENQDSFLILEIRNIQNSLCSRLLIDSSLINSDILFMSLKQLLLKSFQDSLAYEILPEKNTNAAHPILTTQEIFVIKKQQFPSYTPKLVDVVKKHKQNAKILINKINFGNLWRSRAKSEILVQGDVRLDLQGLDSEKFNYQLQTGKDTISAVLIDTAISKITIPSEQSYAIRKIKSGFQQSLDTLCIYRISFSSH